MILYAALPPAGRNPFHAHLSIGKCCSPRFPVRKCAKFGVLVQLQERAGWVCLGMGLLALTGRVALLQVRPIPQPAVHDEVAYLLGAGGGRRAVPPDPTAGGA